MGALTVPIVALGGAGLVAPQLQQIAMNEQQMALARGQAESAAKLGRYESETIRRQTERRKMQLRDASRRSAARANVAYGRSGLDGAGGSAVEVLSGRAAEYERELADVDYDGSRRADLARYGGMRQQAAGLARVGRYRAQNGNIMIGMGMDMGQSLLSSGL